MTQNRINAPHDVLQIVRIKQSGAINIDTVIPSDNTIPQITEGEEVLSLAITPTSATSKLKIFCSAVGTCDSGTNSFIMALFTTASNDALAAKRIRPTASIGNVLDLVHWMTSGTTSTLTFKMRLGIPTAGDNFYLNCDNVGNALMFGTSNTMMSIVEYR